MTTPVIRVDGVSRWFGSVVAVSDVTFDIHRGLTNVIIGASVAASSVTSRSKRAPASVGSDCQNSSALSHISPRGVNSRPARYA